MNLTLVERKHAILNTATYLSLRVHSGTLTVEYSNNLIYEGMLVGNLMKVFFQNKFLGQTSKKNQQSSSEH